MTRIIAIALIALRSAIRSRLVVSLSIVLLLALIGGVFLLPPVNAAVIGFFWFMLKLSVFVYLMLWFKGTFPRFRYDQLMNIGWKVAIPAGMAAVVVNAVLGIARAALP